MYLRIGFHSRRLSVAFIHLSGGEFIFVIDCFRVDLSVRNCLSLVTHGSDQMTRFKANVRPGIHAVHRDRINALTNEGYSHVRYLTCLASFQLVRVHSTDSDGNGRNHSLCNFRRSDSVREAKFLFRPNRLHATQRSRHVRGLAFLRGLLLIFKEEFRPSASDFFLFAKDFSVGRFVWYFFFRFFHFYLWDGWTKGVPGKGKVF